MSNKKINVKIEKEVKKAKMEQMMRHEAIRIKIGKNGDLEEQSHAMIAI